MTHADLRGLPAFLSFLTTCPSPDAVAEALMLGPLAGIGSRGVLIWARRESLLVAVGSHGYGLDEVDRVAIVPRQGQFALWRALDERRIVATSGPRHDGSLAARLDPGMWQAIFNRMGGVTAVRIPLVVGDDGVGAMITLIDGPFDPGNPERPVMEAAAAAVALWSRSPAVGLDARVDAVLASDSAVTLAFSARQQQILLLVEAGHTTAAIARRMALSESAVKQDLQRTMAALGARSRSTAVIRARELALIGPPLPVEVPWP